MAKTLEKISLDFNISSKELDFTQLMWKLNDGKNYAPIEKEGIGSVILVPYEKKTQGNFQYLRNLSAVKITANGKECLKIINYDLDLDSCYKNLI